MLGVLTLVMMLLISPNLVSTKLIDLKKEPVKISQAVKIENVYWWENAPPPRARNGKPMPEIWWTWVKKSSKKYGTNPFNVASVMDVEMNGWKSGLAGTGKNGRKYVGPCGFNKHCQIPWEDIWVPEKQIDRCAWLLSGSLQKRLKSYNTEWRRNNYIPHTIGNAKRMKADALKILGK